MRLLMRHWQLVAACQASAIPLTLKTRDSPLFLTRSDCFRRKKGSLWSGVVRERPPPLGSAANGRLRTRGTCFRNRYATRSRDRNLYDCSNRGLDRALP